MSDLIFVLKCLILTFVASVILQIKVGGLTLETHMKMTASSPAIQNHLQLAAQGASELSRKVAAVVAETSKGVMDSVMPTSTPPKK